MFSGTLDQALVNRLIGLDDWSGQVTGIPTQNPHEAAPKTKHLTRQFTNKTFLKQSGYRVTMLCVHVVRRFFQDQIIARCTQYIDAEVCASRDARGTLWARFKA